jgi:hypothetical protein
LIFIVLSVPRAVVMPAARGTSSPNLTGHNVLAHNLIKISALVVSSQRPHQRSPSKPDRLGLPNELSLLDDCAALTGGVGAELVIHGGDLRDPWTVVIGHDRRSWRYDCCTAVPVPLATSQST